MKEAHQSPRRVPEDSLQEIQKHWSECSPKWHMKIWMHHETVKWCRNLFDVKQPERIYRSPKNFREESQWILNCNIQAVIYRFNLQDSFEILVAFHFSIVIV